ncbi:MAG: hypothetical protein O7C60_04000 [Rickettsia endosymbiont of Ixodes persulcatus]|nr:hypothetical protein [Rickettsia endosymbiont of Ixodes persulcatus]
MTQSLSTISIILDKKINDNKLMNNIKGNIPNTISNYSNYYLNILIVSQYNP